MRAGLTVAEVTARLRDLELRLNEKASALMEMTVNDPMPQRLRGKSEGVRLALSFVEELRRDLTREVRARETDALGPERDVQ